MFFSAENLACRRGMRVVFRDVSFTLAGGEALLVTGANGSGKSSLLRVLAGLLPGLRGSISWGGEAMDWDTHRTRLHYLGHLNAVKPELTVSETLDYWRVLRSEKSNVVLPPLRGELEGGSRRNTDAGLNAESPHPTSPLKGKESFRSLLDLISLTALRDEPIRILSAGQRRRLALARLMMGDAPLWLLDEPASSLDTLGQELLMSLIAQHRAKGGVTIIATHDAMNLPGAKELRLP